MTSKKHVMKITENKKQQKATFEQKPDNISATFEQKPIKTSSIQKKPDTMVTTTDLFFTCKYCDKQFSFRQSMNRHIKYTCTKNKDEDLKELVRLMNKRMEKQDETIESQSKQIEKLMGKLEISGSFNTTISNNVNNITLLSYRETDLSHLTDQDYQYCIKRVNHCVKSMIEKVHFNPLKPENMNIYISNIKDKYIMLYDGQNWNVANKKYELDRLYEEKEMMLEEWLDSNPDQELKDKFVKYLNNKDNDECLNQIKEEIKMMIYNSHQKLALKNGV
jgi:hypothetical protein